MKAIILNEVGSVEHLTYTDIEKPKLKNGEILVETKAIGINRMDIILRKNEQMLTRFVGDKKPYILGWDISGDVVDKAEDVANYEIGDAVFGISLFGKGYAEYVAVNANTIAPKPENISYVEAAAIPIVGTTAWEALVEVSKIKKGDKVLIHGGSGGVGHMAIQIAKSFGATVITTASGKNHDFVLSMGADQHIDYKTEKVNELIKDIDIVFDSVGGATREESLDIVKKNGIIVSIAPPNFETAKVKADEKGVNLQLLRANGNRKELESLTELLQNELLKVHISNVFLFSQMVDAHLQLESNQTVGKIVVEL